jgi:1-acyl-sn-glycerol-3-phosphate acyltransferase
MPEEKGTGADRTDGERAFPPGEATRRVLRWLYAPYAWLVFVPFMVLATLVLASSLLLVNSLGFPQAAVRIGNFWCRLVFRANLCRWELTGRQHIRPGQSYVILSNHQSHFDILALLSALPMDFRFVVKKELAAVPLWGPGMSAMGHIIIDRKDREAAIRALREARPRLVNGLSVLFFPEGTRSRNGRMLPFKKGGFMMALQLGLPILPISILGTNRILPGKSFQLLPGKARLQIHPPIETTGLGEEKRDELMAQVRQVIGSGLTPWERGEV